MTKESGSLRPSRRNFAKLDGCGHTGRSTACVGPNKIAGTGGDLSRPFHLHVNAGQGPCICSNL